MDRGMIGEATGLPPVHVDRVIRRLRERRLVEFNEGYMIVGNVEQWAAVASGDSRPSAATSPLSGSRTPAANRCE
jgi:hypothetical protein